MSNCCCGVCHRIKVNNNSFNGSMFVKGFKRCRTCKIWMLAINCFVGATGKLHCPCCKCQVAHSPRGRKSQEWDDYKVGNRI